MTPIVYVAGRYRHYNLDGSLDIDAMLDEIDDERMWAEVVARAGGLPIRPLHNSVDLGESIPEISEGDWIARQCALIRTLNPGNGKVLMRPGWDHEPVSEGSHAEHAMAQGCGIEIVHGMQGADAVAARVRYLCGMAA